jgi:hypothetical protein
MHTCVEQSLIGDLPVNDSIGVQQTQLFVEERAYCLIPGTRLEFVVLEGLIYICPDKSTNDLVSPPDDPILFYANSPVPAEIHVMPSERPPATLTDGRQRPGTANPITAQIQNWRGRDGNDPSVDIAKDADQRF